MFAAQVFWEDELQDFHVQDNTEKTRKVEEYLVEFRWEKTAASTARCWCILQNSEEIEINQRTQIIWGLDL